MFQCIGPAGISRHIIGLENDGSGDQRRTKFDQIILQECQVTKGQNSKMTDISKLTVGTWRSQQSVDRLGLLGGAD